MVSKILQLDKGIFSTFYFQYHQENAYPLLKLHFKCYHYNNQIIIGQNFLLIPHHYQKIIMGKTTFHLAYFQSLQNFYLLFIPLLKEVNIHYVHHLDL